MEFWAFGRGQNIFNLRGVVLLGGGVYYVGTGQFIFHPFSHFEMQDFKNSKKICLQHSFSIFTVSDLKQMHAELQVDIDFNTESKFSFSRSSFFSPLSGH